ncbi:MAG: SRPBCC domain-containing protein, partial [Candidatus Udaeobacter sp.]
MTTKAAEKTSLHIKRFINAPRARVYAAWTDPAQLKEWWGPETVRTRNFAADVRVGGKYRWDLINQEDEEMSVFGEYRELVPEKKIVFTWKWDDDDVWENRNSVVTVELFDAAGGTELHLRHEQLPSTESRDRHNEGWN